MRYEDLNGHFRERIRERVSHSLAKLHPDQPVNPSIRDYLVGVIILVADENNVVLAAERLHKMEVQNPATA